MKIITRESLNDSLMTGYFKDKELQKIKFEKACYTKDDDNVLSHYFTLYFEKAFKSDVLYKVSAEFTSPLQKYEPNTFELGFVEKFDNFIYKDKNTLQNVVIKVPSRHPTIEKIWKKPVHSPFFRDFVNAYNSNLDNPIDVEQTYANRLFHPTDDFEKLLYSDADKSNYLLDQIKFAYRAERIR